MVELLSIVLAMIALSSKRFLFCTQIILSAITAFWVYGLFYPNMEVIEFSEWDWPTIKQWINNGNGILSILFTILCYLFFYWILKVAVQWLVSKPLEKKYRNQLARLTILERRMVNIVVVRKVRKSVRWMFKYRIIKPSPQPTTYTIHEHLSRMYSLFCWALHIICCWFVLGLNNSVPIYVLAIIVFVIVSLLVISSAFVVPFFDIFSRAAREEELTAAR